jgi:hypothetical protein
MKKKVIQPWKTSGEPPSEKLIMVQIILVFQITAHKKLKVIVPSSITSF